MFEVDWSEVQGRMGREGRIEKMREEKTGLDWLGVQGGMRREGRMERKINERGEAYLG